MKAISQIIDPQVKEEIELAEARKIAKDMSCLKHCQKSIRQPIEIHNIDCPYWEPNAEQKKII